MEEEKTRVLMAQPSLATNQPTPQRNKVSRVSTGQTSRKTAQLGPAHIPESGTITGTVAALSQ
jgi:hypothetical protein